jgi:hypothetical protein
MKDLSEEVTKAIQSALPSLVAGELQEYIEQAERNKEKLESEKTSNKWLREQNDTVAKERDDLRALNNNAEQNKQDREAIDQEKRELTVKLAELERDAYKRERDTVVNLVTNLFRNTEYRSNMFESFSKHIPPHQGNNFSSYNESNSYNKTGSNEAA